MPAGRPPKPTALKVLEGNPGKRNPKSAAPEFSEADLDCPKWLLPEAREEWRRVLPLLREAKVITAADRAVLAAYCQSWARWQEAEREVTQQGLTMTIDTKFGSYEQVRPEVSIAQRYHSQMLVAAAKLGFDPASRSRLNLPEAEAEDPFDGFIKRSSAGG